MDNTTSPSYKNQNRLIKFFGIIFLLFGLANFMLGPIEMYCFYLFSEGGRFYYEGFGFGAFMFANIAVQITGYYLLAILFIPLGYGHWRLRRWARKLMLATLWFWTILGLPLSIILLTMFAMAKDPSLFATLLVIVILALFYPLIPTLMIRFYQSDNVRKTFSNNDTNKSWIDERPLPILVLSFLYIFDIFTLHSLIFLRGAFPLFGVLVLDLPGVILITFSMLILGFITWGTLEQRLWAWWGALIYFSLLTASVLTTLPNYPLGKILPLMKFAPIEVEAFGKIPFQYIHFTAFFSLPLFLTLAAIYIARKNFSIKHN